MDLEALTMSAWHLPAVLPVPYVHPDNAQKDGDFPDDQEQEVDVAELGSMEERGNRSCEPSRCAQTAPNQAFPGCSA